MLVIPMLLYYRYLYIVASKRSALFSRSHKISGMEDQWDKNWVKQERLIGVVLCVENYWESIIINAHRPTQEVVDRLILKDIYQEYLLLWQWFTEF